MEIFWGWGGKRKKFFNLGGGGGGFRQKLVSLLKYTSTFIAVLKVKRIYLKCYLEKSLI